MWENTVTLALSCSIQVAYGNTSLVVRREGRTGTRTMQSRQQLNELTKCCLMRPSVDAIEPLARAIYSDDALRSM